jgi:hypothetical protein
MRFSRQAIVRGVAIVGARRKRLAFGVVVIVALGMCSAALATTGVAGTYATTISSPADLRGTWVLTLAKGGTYTVTLNGAAVARGRYSATATTITFRRETGSGCSGPGTYAWKKSGTTMRFIRKREHPTCQGRAAVLAHRFTQRR